MQSMVYPHIQMRDDGQAEISGTGTKVIMIAMDRLAYHWDADEIQRQRPHLTLAQIYGALTYYYDHEEDMNRQIWKEQAFVEEMATKLDNPSLRAKLEAAKQTRCG